MRFNPVANHQTLHRFRSRNSANSGIGENRLNYHIPINKWWKSVWSLDWIVDNLKSCLNVRLNNIYWKVPVTSKTIPVHFNNFILLWLQEQTSVLNMNRFVILAFTFVLFGCALTLPTADKSCDCGKLVSFMLHHSPKN